MLQVPPPRRREPQRPRAALAAQLLLCAIAAKRATEWLLMRRHVDYIGGEMVESLSWAGSEDVLLVGNGPLTRRQRAMIRGARPSQIWRFNGMTNLHPGEPVGNLFARKCSNATTPGQYWGVKPPLNAYALLDWLFVPSFGAISTRFQCERIREAVSVTLLQGSDLDAEWCEAEPRTMLQSQGIQCSVHH